MGTEYGLWCRDFYINQKLALKLDLPAGREPVLELFDRVRKQAPSLRHLRRFDQEIVLESDDHDRTFSWVTMRQTSLRSGMVNPPSLDAAYALHRTVLEVAPWYLSISPLDVEHLELIFCFDFETEGNRDQIIWDALLAESPLAALVDLQQERPIDVQPFMGLSLSPSNDLQAYFEVKSRTKSSEPTVVRAGEEPISVYLTVRRSGPIQAIAELPTLLATLCGHAERLAEDRVIPHIVKPIRDAITAS
ncbi:MAG: hypothetical protein KF724_03975 [Phycisphaeraceae bacterium]|nr:hypothetical protein [Phycisphaeraceae bacterium]